MSICDHQKVYANFTLTSNPPQFTWICRKCGVKGTDGGWKGYSPSITYEEVELAFRRKPNDG